MSMTADAPRWGIRVHLPQNDPMAAEHLLGADWQGLRWYANAADRDAAFLQMETQPPWYRRGDTPSVRLEKVDPD